MRCVVQRVTRASVTVDGETVGAVGPGLMVLIGVSSEDTENDLKYIADSYGMYYDSSYRKPDLVHGISDRFGGGNVAKIFENMGISEFLVFKRLVLSETPGEEKWEYLLTELCNRGLILTIPKTGLRVASEVLEYYEGWYGTETEAFVSRIEETLVSSVSTGAYCAPVRVFNYYVTFPAKNGVENEAKLLNPKKGLTTGTKVRIRYLPGQADCAVLDPRSTVA